MYVRAISIRLSRGRSTPEIRAIVYPCRCLCRGFLQMMRTTPRRRTTLQFSQIGLTELRTFMCHLPSLSRCPREHFGSDRGDRHGVLEVGRERAVGGYDRPRVFPRPNAAFAVIDHRLDCDHQAGIERKSDTDVA